MRNMLLLTLMIFFISCSFQEGDPIIINLSFPEDLVGSTYQILYEEQDSKEYPIQYIIFAKAEVWTDLGFGMEVRPPVDRGYKITEYSSNKRAVIGECNMDIDGNTISLQWLDDALELCTLLDIEDEDMKLVSDIHGSVEWIKIE